MSIQATPKEREKIAKEQCVTLYSEAKPWHGYGVQIIPRLIAIAMRNYNERPGERKSAARFLLTNAVRLGVQDLGREEAARLVLMALQGCDQ